MVSHEGAAAPAAGFAAGFVVAPRCRGGGRCLGLQPRLVRGDDRGVGGGEGGGERRGGPWRCGRRSYRSSLPGRRCRRVGGGEGRVGVGQGCVGERLPDRVVGDAALRRHERPARVLGGGGERGAGVGADGRGVDHGGVGGLRPECVGVAHLRLESLGRAFLRRGLLGGDAVLVLRPRPRTTRTADHEDGGDDGDDAARGSADGRSPVRATVRSASKGNRHPARAAERGERGRTRPPPSGGTALRALKATAAAGRSAHMTDLRPTLSVPASGAHATPPGVRPLTADELGHLDRARAYLRASGADLTDLDAVGALLHATRTRWAAEPDAPVPQAMVMALGVGVGDLVVARVPGSRWALRTAGAAPTPAVVSLSGEDAALPLADVATRWRTGCTPTWVAEYVAAAAAHLTSPAAHDVPTPRVPTRTAPDVRADEPTTAARPVDAPPPCRPAHRRRSPRLPSPLAAPMPSRSAAAAGPEGYVATARRCLPDRARRRPGAWRP